MSRVTDQQINAAIPVSTTGTPADQPSRSLTRDVLRGIRDMAELTEWFTVSSSTSLGASDSGKSAWVVSHVTLTLESWASMPSGWAVEIIPKRGAPLNIFVAATGGDSILGGVTRIKGPAVIFRSPESGLFQVEGMAE